MDLSVEFLGGALAGKHRSPVSEDELAQLGYRGFLVSRPAGAELATGFAVPAEWSVQEAHQAVLEKSGAGKDRPPGKRSV